MNEVRIIPIQGIPEIKVDDNADLIIAVGDDVIPNILGIFTDCVGLGAGGSGRIRCGSIGRGICRSIRGQESSQV